jgi:hypothetical protein
MPAPEGNQNAAKGREWRNAINRALAIRGNGDRTAALDELAKKFIETTVEMTQGTEKRGPSIAGFSELADRLDGRSPQSITHSGDADNPVVIHAATITVIDPDGDGTKS